MLEQITGKYTLKQIFEDHWSHFLSVHHVRDSVKENVEKMMNCGNREKLGHHLYRCKKCGIKRYVANTCKSRFCNSCGKIATDKWIACAQKRFVNVPHHHIVFSPPSELWLFKSLIAPPIARCLTFCLKRLPKSQTVGAKKTALLRGFV